MADVSVLSDGVNTYDIKDATARSDISTLDGNVVKLTGDQTIAGHKVLTESLSVLNENIHLRTNFAKGTAPASDNWRQYTVSDNSGSADNAHKLGYLAVVSNTDGTQTTRLGAFKNVAGNTDSTQLYIGYNSSGTIITSAPACSNTNSIVTTTGISKNSDGYVKLGNGLIIQKGVHSVSASGSSTLTFPTAFGNTDWQMGVCRLAGSSTTNDSGSFYVRGKTTTTASIYVTTNTRSIMWIAIGY